MNCSYDEPTAPQPALLPIQTSILDPVSGGSGSRAYRACKKVLTGADTHRLGNRFVVLHGDVLPNDVEGLLTDLNAELMALSAGPMSVIVGDIVYWLGIERDVICSK